MITYNIWRNKKHSWYSPTNPLCAFQKRCIKLAVTLTITNGKQSFTVYIWQIYDLKTWLCSDLCFENLFVVLKTLKSALSQSVCDLKSCRTLETTANCCIIVIGQCVVPITLFHKLHLWCSWFLRNLTQYINSGVYFWYDSSQ